MMTAVKPKRLLSKSFILLIAVSLITSLGFTMISTLISSYAVSFGVQLTATGIISGVFSITALLFRPFGGYITDTGNKKYICVCTTALIGLFVLSYSISNTVWLLIIIRILHGAVFAISSTASLALATEFIPDNMMGQGLGYFGLGQVLSQIAGLSIGIMIRDTMGYHALFIIIALLTFLSAAILFFAFPYRLSTVQLAENKREKRKFSVQHLIAKECIVYALIAGLFSMGNGIVNSFLVLLGENREIANISLFFSVNAVFLFLLRLFASRVIDKARLLVIVNLSLLASIVSMILIGHTSLFPVLLLAAVLKAFGNVGGQISLQSACVKKVNAAKIGIATSTYYIGADIGQGLGPIWGGKIAESFGYSAVFYCMAAIFLAAIILFTLYERRFFIRKNSLISKSNHE